MRILLVFFCALIALGWLLPNHYLPWVSAWGDGVTMLGLLGLMFVVTGNVSPSNNRISWRLPAIAAVCMVTVLGQLATGKLLYSGDAVMAILYIGLWLGAVIVGRLMLVSYRLADGMDVLAAVWLLAAILSVTIALVQWTGTRTFYIFSAELPPGARPFANVAQPNHLSTLCFVGLCSLLWLFQVGKARAPFFFFGAGVLLLGMVISQSRTGWLQIGLLLAWGVVMRQRANLRPSSNGLLLLGIFYAFGVILWPWICEITFLTPGRLLGEQMQPGVRLTYWWSMIDALGRKPLFGYGWLQTGVAHQLVAQDHPPMGALFDYSHNFILDLLLWTGIPAGAVVVSILAWWFADQIRACRDARQVWLLAAVAGVFVHGLLEYPLAYAYFLIPVGLAMGAIEGIVPDDQKTICLSQSVIWVFSVILAVLFVAVANDYLSIEERFRNLRFEMKRIGIDRVRPPESKALLLTQLEALMVFYRTEAHPSMSPEQLDAMRKVSERYGYPPVLMRYALASGLNGQPVVASETLARICSIHMPQRCSEAREGWSEAQVRYPQLKEVKMPIVR